MKQNVKLKLPIDDYINEILEAVRDYSTIIVKASPGSGKTTRLPWAMARNTAGKVAVLEPRRLAAKMAAARIADEENVELGKEVGHHFRFDKNISDDTKLIFYTEGTFLKKFLSDPEMHDIDVVVLDEFHERHLDTDLAFALLRKVQEKRKLKIVLMSATLDLELLKVIPDSHAVEIIAPLHPVEISYLPNQPSVLNQSIESKVKKAVESTDGDTLVFLPGMREMLRVKDVLSNQNVFLLHADLSKEEQALALSPSSRRKIILSTNIAESSVTIPGIKVVIDSGFQREAKYSPWNGLKIVQDSKSTKSSAIQRAGRAGRTGPGICWRLYSEQDFNEREEHTIPEIERADLTDVCLLVKGTKLTPKWFHSPDTQKWKKSEELLFRIGAVSEMGELTSIGKRILEYPVDTRLGRVLIEGENLLQKEKEKLLSYICDEIEQDRSGTLKRRLGFFLKKSGISDSPWQKPLLAGFIDQVAKFRPKQRDFIHYSGKILKAHQSLHDLQEGLYIVFDITQRQEAIQVLEIMEEWPWELEPFPFQDEDEIKIFPKIEIKKRTKLGSIVIDEASVKLQWNDLSEELKNRIRKDSASIKEEEIKKWKDTPAGQRIIYWSAVQKNPLDELLNKLDVQDYLSQNDKLDWENFPQFVDQYIHTELNIGNIESILPSKINLGGRRDLIVHYPEGMDPYLEAPIQDFYGLNETPALMNGKVPLTLKLLGPHKRPIQITKDLKSFWQKTYQEMKKEYQRDYPRHYWPDKPWEAKPFLLKSHLPKA